VSCYMLGVITCVASCSRLSIVIISSRIEWLPVRFARERMCAASALLFPAVSMCCRLARTLPMMVLFRVLQGAGGGVLMTVSQAIVREAFPLHEQGIAMGVYGMGVVLAPAFGPTLGGWLTDRYAWPWIFYVNVPIGLLNVLLVQRFIADPPYLVRERGRVDVPGIALLAL